MVIIMMIGCSKVYILILPRFCLIERLFRRLPLSLLGWLKLTSENVLEMFARKEASIAPKLSLEAISIFSYNFQIRGIDSISNIDRSRFLSI